MPLSFGEGVIAKIIEFMAGLVMGTLIVGMFYFFYYLFKPN